MKAIVGIDASDESLRAGMLLMKLACSKTELTLVDVVEPEPVSLYAHPMMPSELIAESIDAAVAAGRKRLDDCKAELSWRLGDPQAVTTSLRRGYAANELIAAATEQAAELIAVGSRDAGVMERMMAPSVSRKLVASAPCSVLVARSQRVPEGKLRVVFATDHSPYAARCAQLLAKMAPQGFAELTVVTAYSKVLADLSRQGGLGVQANVCELVKQHLAAENAKVLRQFAGLNCALSSHVVEGAAVAAIERVGRELSCDLYILGAQGHGFLDRLATGSVSFHFATTSEVPVLILRP